MVSTLLVSNLGKLEKQGKQQITGDEEHTNKAEQWVRVVMRQNARADTLQDMQLINQQNQLTQSKVTSTGNPIANTGAIMISCAQYTHIKRTIIIKSSNSSMTMVRQSPHHINACLNDQRKILLLLLLLLFLSLLLMTVNILLASLDSFAITNSSNFTTQKQQRGI